jgi:hypothetical protein
VQLNAISFLGLVKGTIPGLVPESLLYEAEEHLIGLPCLLGLGCVEDSRHVAQLVRQQGRLPALQNNKDIVL